MNGRRLEEHYVPAEYDDIPFLSGNESPSHSYFLLGDHRTSSSDSRDFGPVDQRFIYGKAVFVYWPMDNWGN